MNKVKIYLIDTSIIFFISIFFLLTAIFIIPHFNSRLYAARTPEEACDTTLPPGLNDKCSGGIFGNNTCEFIPDGNNSLPWNEFTLSGSPQFEKTTYGHNGDTHIMKISPRDGKDYVAGVYITFDTTPGKTYCASWRWGPNTDNGNNNPYEKTMGLDPTGQTNASNGSIVWGSTVNKTSRQLDYNPVGVDVNYNTDIKTVATGSKMTLFVKAHFNAKENSFIQMDQINVFDEGYKNGGTSAPTATPQQTQPTNTPPPQNYSCPASSSQSYDKRSIRNMGDRQPAENHPDKNIHVRGYTGTNQDKQIVFNGGDRDNSAPQFSTVLPNSKPPITRLFQIYNWNWGQGSDWGSKGGPQTSPWPVSVMGLGANPSDNVMLADSGYNVIDGYEAYVLYASEDTLTAVYLNNDRVVGDNNNGYAIHYDSICVDPNLLSLYRSLNNQGRKELPVLKGKQVIGKAKTSEIIVSMRDSGEFMDPRSDAWWLGINSLPTGQPPSNPTATSTQPAPTNTPTQQQCSSSSIPQFTAPQGNTVTAGTYNISWTAPSGATNYHLRINDHGANNQEARFSGNCGITQFPGDICADNLTKNTYSYTFQNGHQYDLWVHSSSSCGYSEPGSVSVVASSVNTACVIQGYKIDTDYNASNTSISPLIISVKSPNNSISYTNQSNPYSFSVPGNQDYQVSTDLPSDGGYSASSTLCINKTDCHNLTDTSLANSSVRNFRCPEGGYADLWWHYQKTSQCATPSTPSITKVTRNPQGVLLPSIDQIDIAWETTDKPTVPYMYKLEMSTDGQQTWSTILNNYKETSHTTYIYDDTSICARVSAINNCGAIGKASEVVCSTLAPTPTPISTSPYPTPTLKPTTAQLQCYGTQHCTNGNTTMFEYCGNCDGAGCAGNGFTCRDSNMTCKTYPGKVFYFDDVYPIDCKLLSPTPTNSPLPQLTCSNCDLRNPYLCSTIAATGSGRAATTFCHDRPAPASSYSCTKCEIPASKITPTVTPKASVTYSPPEQATFSLSSNLTREKIGNLLERITIQWNPIKEGAIKLEISYDGVTWETRLNGTEQYPYNYYTTTVANVVDRPIIARISVVTPDGQQSQTNTTIFDPVAQTTTAPTSSTSWTRPTSAPISPMVIAAGGLIVAAVIAGFMIGI